MTMQPLAGSLAGSGRNLKVKGSQRQKNYQSTSLFKFPPADLNNRGQAKDCWQKPRRQLSPFELRGERKIYGLGGISVRAFKNVLEKVSPVNAEPAP